MSTEPDKPTPWADERITAYVMNELNGEETAAFKAELENNEPLADAVQQAREVTAKLAGFYGSIATDTLDAERLSTVLEETDEPVTVKPNDSQRKPWLGLLIAASIVLVLAGVSIPMMTNSSTRNVAMTATDEIAAISTDSQLDVARLDEKANDEMRMSVAHSSLSPQTLSEPASKSKTPVVEMTELALPGVQKEPLDAGKMVGGYGLPSNTTEVSRQQRASKLLPAAATEVRSPNSGSLAGGYGLPGHTTKIQSPRPSRGLERSRETVEMGMDMELGGMGMGMDMGMDMGMGMGMDMFGRERLSGDKYESLVENSFKRVSDHPLSTLSIDVDTASYSKIRMSLQRNQLPPADAVRIEEMINYFEYDYEKVSDTLNSETGKSDPFSASLKVTTCPWQPEHRLVRVGLQAIEIDKQERPRCNLVFLIDTSGSMQSARKLPLLIEGMKRMIKELRDDDQVAIVVYAGSAGLVLDSTPAKKRGKINRALSMLKAGGSTNGGAGLRLAYETARENFIKEGVNRVILCSDGDFNVGMTGTDELVREAKSQAKSGVELTVLGFGMGNHNDAMMERISNDAEGNYAFIDTIAESKKVLGEQLSGTLVTVAKDVKIQVEFNPAVVSAYRLIGYENRLLAKEDFNDDTKDAGEIGAGHRVTALYQVVPVGVQSDPAMRGVDPLKYQKPKTPAEPEPELADDTSGEMLQLKLRYKPPQGDKSILMTRTLVDDGDKFTDADDDFRFAAAVAGFGMQLRGSSMKGSWTYDDVLQVAIGAKGEDEHGLRVEMIGLTATASKLNR